MPKTLLEKVVFTIVMATIMVYGMIVYNVALNTGGVTNATFLMALHEMPINSGKALSAVHCTADQPSRQMMPRSANGPCQSGYSPSRADSIGCSGSRLTGRVFGLNGNFSARIFSYAMMSSSCCSVRSMSS